MKIGNSEVHYLATDNHQAIISKEVFEAVQIEKRGEAMWRKMRMGLREKVRNIVLRENERNECDRGQFGNLRGEKIWPHTHIKMIGEKI